MNKETALTLIQKLFPDNWSELVAPYREITKNYYPRSWLQACLYLASGGTKTGRSEKVLKRADRKEHL